jgi:hypothetical protein
MTRGKKLLSSASVLLLARRHLSSAHVLWHMLDFVTQRRWMAPESGRIPEVMGGPFQEIHRFMMTIVIM